MTTKPEVFIIESLRFKDEKDKTFEGEILSKILALSGKTCEYYYIRTQRELGHVLKLFALSGYRYLHLSCHGSSTGMATTLDSLTFPELAQLATPHLDGRRLFISACSMVNDRLARAIMPQSRCSSILGPTQTVNFDDAAILWASLYHVLFAEDATAIKRQTLTIKAQEVADMYRVKLRYFTRDSTSKNGYTAKEIVPTAES
jgi:hypothetical protein